MAACCNPVSQPSAPPGLDGCQHPSSSRSDRGAATQPSFGDAEGLRRLLVRLDRAGPGSWRTDPEAAALMTFCADRYAALARKFDQTPHDAATAAFEAMLYDSTMTAEDPWAVVTVAVRITLIAQHRADGMLTSSVRARRAEYSVFHDAERFSDRDTPPDRYHPAFQTKAHPTTETTAERRPWVIAQTAYILAKLGWPAGISRVMVTHVCARLVDIGDRESAYDRLRRDKTTRARFGLTHDDWIVLLKACLGDPCAKGRLGEGLLACLLMDDDIADLLADPDVARAMTPIGCVRVGERVG